MSLPLCECGMLTVAVTACLLFNLSAPCVQYMGQAFRYSPENAFYLFNQQMYLII